MMSSSTTNHGPNLLARLWPESCLACGGSYPDIAHVMADRPTCHATKTAQGRKNPERQNPPFYNNNANKNLIFLYASCHKQFDSNDSKASMVLLPTDSTTPIKWEKKNGHRMKEVPTNLGGIEYRFYCF